MAGLYLPRAPSPLILPSRRSRPDLWRLPRIAPYRCASPAFRAKTETTGGTAADLTQNRPTGTANDDILVAVIGKDDNVAPGIPAGWTLLTSGLPTAANSCWIYWKRAASEPASWTWTFASVWREGVVLAYSGVPTTGNPYDPDPLAAITLSASASTLNCNGNTTLTADTTVLLITTNEGGGAWTLAAGYTFRATSQGGLASGGEVCVGDKAFVGPGAVAAASHTSGTVSAMTGFMLILRSIASGGAPAPRTALTTLGVGP